MANISPDPQHQANVGKCIDFTSNRTVNGQFITEELKEYKITDSEKLLGTVSYEAVSEKGTGVDKRKVYPFMIRRMYHCEQQQQAGRRKRKHMRKTRKNRKASKRTRRR